VSTTARDPDDSGFPFEIETGSGALGPRLALERGQREHQIPSPNWCCRYCPNPSHTCAFESELTCTRQGEGWANEVELVAAATDEHKGEGVQQWAGTVVKVKAQGDVLVVRSHRFDPEGPREEPVADRCGKSRCAGKVSAVDFEASLKGRRDEATAVSRLSSLPK
jgi:hypothetical protein